MADVNGNIILNTKLKLYKDVLDANSITSVSTFITKYNVKKVDSKYYIQETKTEIIMNIL